GMHTIRKQRRVPTGTEIVRSGNAAVTVYSGTHSTGLPRWRVVDKTAGKRRLRDFYSRAEAMKEAGRIADLLANGQSIAAGLTNVEALEYGRAIERLRPLGISLDLAVSRFA